MHIGEGGLKFNPAVKLEAVHVSALPWRLESPEERRVSAPLPSRSLSHPSLLSITFKSPTFTSFTRSTIWNMLRVRLFRSSGHDISMNKQTT